MNFIGIQSLIVLLSHLFFVGLSHQVLQIVRFDHLIKKGNTQQLKFLYILIAITIGYSVSNFFLDFIMHTQNLFLLFQ